MHRLPLFFFYRAEWFISIAANGALGFLVRCEASEFFYPFIFLIFARLLSIPVVCFEIMGFLRFSLSKWFSGVRA